MSTKVIFPARLLNGEARVPGDKSIAHRLAIIGAISDGVTFIENFPTGADCASTLTCLKRLGISIERNDGQLKIVGKGLGGLRPPESVLDAGNSGTTVRLLSGVLAAQPFESVVVGDASLSRRPMERVIEPLGRFGASVIADNGGLPLKIRGAALRSIQYRPPIPSAQVKSAVLFAGLYASGITSVKEQIPTRNHTEIALAESNARIKRVDEAIEVEGGWELSPRNVRIPGDLSSAAFLIAAALALPGSYLRLREVGVNPTRSAYLDFLGRLGCSPIQESIGEAGGEPVADLVVRSAELSRVDVAAEEVPGLIDELPILAVLGACTGAGVRIRGAGELRAKESDRIGALVSNLASIGFQVEEFEDGLEVASGGQAKGGAVRSFGDHRIAMAFAVAGLLSKSGVRIEDPECVDISFPGFFDVLEKLTDV